MIISGENIKNDFLFFSIKVWNVTEDLKSMYSYNSAHCDTITCVSAQPKSDSIFASTSVDSNALTWDIRKAKPAHGRKIKTNQFLITKNFIFHFFNYTICRRDEFVNHLQIMFIIIIVTYLSHYCF